MNRDFTIPLWLLKLGAPLNLYFLLNIPAAAPPVVVVPAQILFFVSAFRCVFPVRYEKNVVFHDSLLSSIVLTRFLATIAEVAYIFLFSYVLRVLDTAHDSLVSALSWMMVVQVVVSQVLVWAAVLTGRLSLYFYEELGWGLIFAANTVASVWLYNSTGVSANHFVLLQLNLLFGTVYLPWQFLHLRMLWAQAKRSSDSQVAFGLLRAIQVRNRRTDAQSWGGFIGLSWMIGYWATIIPMWVYGIILLIAGQFRA